MRIKITNEQQNMQLILKNKLNKRKFKDKNR